MSVGSFSIFLLLVLLMVAPNPGVLSAQDNTTAQNSEVGQPVTEENPQILTLPSSEMQWLWGEVSSVDSQKNEITIKYLDYETDTEKEMKIAVDETTAYENVKSINEIKTEDIISVDYVFSPDGRYIAKNISIEKTEDKPELQKKVTGEVDDLSSTATPVTE